MAKNRARANGRKLHANVSAVNGSGAGNLVKSGDPGVLVTTPFVALTDEDGNGMASVDHGGCWFLDVTSAAGDAIAPYEELFWDNAAGAVTNDDAAGANPFFGVALEAVADGATATIEVRIGR